MALGLSRARVVGVVEQARLEGVLLNGALFANDTRQQTHGRIEDHQGRNLPTHEHVIADGDLEVSKMEPDPLVHPFVAAAQQNEALLLAQSLGQRLGEGNALGGEQDYRRRAGLSLNGPESPNDGLRLENHSGPAAVRGIVGRPMLVLGVVAKIVDGHVHHAPIDRLAENALFKRRGEEIREKCDDVDFHGLRIFGGLLVELLKRDDCYGPGLEVDRPDDRVNKWNEVFLAIALYYQDVVAARRDKTGHGPDGLASLGHDGRLDDVLLVKLPSLKVAKLASVGVETSPDVGLGGRAVVHPIQLHNQDLSVGTAGPNSALLLPVLGHEYDAA